jgi:pyrroline-5-carboxylate reductase
MNRIGFVGTGHIAAPMVRHLARKGHEISVTRRSAEVSEALAAGFGVSVGDPQAVLDTSEVVFLCLRPHHAEDILTPLAFRPDHQVVSVMAGVPRDALERLCAPAADFVQTIPLGFLETGDCPLAAFGNDGLLADLFAPENPVVKVADENALNAHFAICAMVPGMLDLMATGAGWLAQRTRDEAAAEFFTTQLLRGFLGAMNEPLAEARDALATDGTISLQMTGTLHRENAHAALVSALDAIGKRLETA